VIGRVSCIHRLYTVLYKRCTRIHRFFGLKKRKKKKATLDPVVSFLCMAARSSSSHITYSLFAALRVLAQPKLSRCVCLVWERGPRVPRCRHPTSVKFKQVACWGLLAAKSHSRPAASD
jgi:hypothetical protein